MYRRFFREYSHVQWFDIEDVHGLMTQQLGGLD